MKPKIRVSHPKHEGEMQVSKWLKIEVLLDPNEMQELFKALGNFSIYNVSEVVSAKSMEISKEAFIQDYKSYIAQLKAGNQSISAYPSFSAVLTNTEKVFYAMPIKDDAYLVRPLKPVIQLRMHHFSYSNADHSFHSMTFGKETVSWGLQFSYPQIYKHSEDEDFCEVLKEDSFPNSSLFKIIIKWMRKNSMPTPFTIDNRRVNTTFRLGKQCFHWIDKHPQLIANHMEILQRRVNAH